MKRPTSRSFRVAHPDGNTFKNRVDELAAALARSRRDRAAYAEPLGRYAEFLNQQIAPAAREPVAIDLVVAMCHVLEQWLPLPTTVPAETEPGAVVAYDLAGLYAWTQLRLSEAGRRYHKAWVAWRKQDDPGFSEEDCARRGTTALLLDLPGLPAPVKAVALECLGRLMLPGIRDAAARARALDRQRPLPAEGMFDLQVFRLSGAGTGELDSAATASGQSFPAAVRYWTAEGAAPDRFYEYAFRQWGWLKPVDFVSPLSADERSQLVQSRLYRAWTVPAAPAGLTDLWVVPGELDPGVPFPLPAAPTGEPTAKAPPPVSADDRALAGPDERHALSPVPVMAVGGKGFGKTSTFSAMAECAAKPGAEEDGPHAPSSRAGWCVRPGKNLLAHHKSERANWLAGKKSNTRDYTHYDVRLIPGGAEAAIPHDGLWVRLTDYPGEHVSPADLDPAARELIRKARGFVFVIDDSFFPARDGSPPSEAAAKTLNWYQEIIAWWAEHNRTVLHIPVALVVNKADKLFGADLARVRPQLLADTVVRELFDERVDLGRRAEAPGPVLATPVQRLRHCLTEDLRNSEVLPLRELTWEVATRCGPLLAQILQITYRLQIFLVRAGFDERKDGAHDQRPFAVLEPLRWLAEQVHRPFLAQAAERLNAAAGSLTVRDGELTLHIDELFAAEKRAAEAEAALRRHDDGRPGAVGRILQDWTHTRDELHKQVLATQARLAAEKGAALTAAGFKPDESALQAPAAVIAARLRPLQEEAERQALELSERADDLSFRLSGATAGITTEGGK